MILWQSSYGWKEQRPGDFWSCDNVLYSDRTLGYTDVGTYQSLGNVHFQFVHFIIFKFHFKIDKLIYQKTVLDKQNAKYKRSVLILPNALKWDG